jgi:hypothetical protein
MMPDVAVMVLELELDRKVLRINISEKNKKMRWARNARSTWGQGGKGRRSYHGDKILQ